ncbi:MAG TPA: nucleoside deaminase [Rickettsiales bacterium]|nr:nucleoside deaminase [Rickettsiales bacterium]
MDKKKFMQEAIKCSFDGMNSNAGGPFGAVIVKDGEIIARGWNKVTSTNDPTAHAEIVTIREACKKLSTFDLSGCELYTSCEPCPMCLAAIYWSKIGKIYYGNTKKDAANIGFDDDFIYEEFALPIEKRSIPMEQLDREDSIKSFEKWAEKNDKIKY